MMKPNLILQTDSYKLSHWKQYPKGTTEVYSYLESRGGKFSHTLFFGLQYYLKEYLSQPVTVDDLIEAGLFAREHLANENIFAIEEWKKLIEKHGGYLPIEINAVPEGTVVPTGNVMMTIHNTDPDFPWVTNFVETLLLKVWYPITVATQSMMTRIAIEKALQETGCATENADFMLHDFGYRGVSSEESAAIGGASHLLSFRGTDTLAAIRFLRHYYNTDKMVGFSVPASEHSTMTSWGRDNEVDAYRNMLEIYPTGVVSVVSDSYDIFNACSEIWGTELKDQVMERDGRLVIRPDSGEVIPTIMKVFDILFEKFDSSTNDKGYRVLTPKVRVIQGDGINYDMVVKILDAMKEKKLAAENIIFGMGGALLQQVNRDTQNFAIKCSSITVDGEQRDVSKNPVNQKMKKSKAGYLGLKYDPLEKDKMITFQKSTSERDGEADLLRAVYRNGTLLTDTSYDKVLEYMEVSKEMNNL